MKNISIEILLVEDNPEDAELTIRELKKHNMGNKLLHLQDGELALQFIFGTGQFKGRDISQPTKLILLDIQMPKVNGMEVLEKIKNHSTTRHIPVVMLTSSKEIPDIKRCYAFGANSYIVKPLDFKKFGEAIRDLGFYWLTLNHTSIQ